MFMKHTGITDGLGRTVIVEEAQSTFDAIYAPRGWVTATQTEADAYFGAPEPDDTLVTTAQLQAALAGFTPSGGSSVARVATTLGRRATLPRALDVDAVMASPPTVGAVATSSAITSGIKYPAVTLSGTTYELTNQFFAYRGAGGPAIQGTGFPNYNFVKFTSLTNPLAGSGTACADFIFDGTTLEIMAKGNGAKVRVRVDGQLISATPTTYGSSSGVEYIPITFATRANRHITVEGDLSFLFGGVQVGPNDTVIKAEIPGPLVIVVGDSFTEGTGATTPSMVWCRRMGARLGWPDVWPSGVGGTGWLNPSTGGKVTFRGRLTNDVLQWISAAYAANRPTVVVWAGGLNDNASSTAAQMQAEVTTCLQLVQAAAPGTVQIVLSPFWSSDVSTFNMGDPGVLAVRDGIKAGTAAASTATSPCYFIPLLEMPIDNPLSTTLSAQANSGATSVNLPVVIPLRSVIEIGTGSTRTRRIVTGVSGGGPFTHTFAQALTQTYASGSAVNEVGPSYITGTGKVGTTTGSGNADLYTSSDGTHPSQAGHDYIGDVVAELIARLVLPA